MIAFVWNILHWLSVASNFQTRNTSYAFDVFESKKFIIVLSMKEHAI